MAFYDDPALANMHWDTAPNWLDEVDRQRLVESVQFERQPTILSASGIQELLDEFETEVLQIRLKPKPEVRARDCSIWIKKNNRYSGGVRQRLGGSRRHRAIMQPLSLDQYRRHAVHLMTRVLNLRTNASPFTLVLDDLNQDAMPLLGELICRGLSRNINVIVVSFEVTRFLPSIRHIAAFGDKSGDEILQDIENALKDAKDSLVIVDSLHDLVKVKNIDMGAIFSLVAVKYTSTLVGVYHQDILPTPNADNAYAPQCLDVFRYMATTIITCKSFAHALAAKAAKERSLPEPTHGLLQGTEGIVQDLDANDHRGIVLEAEFRRKSGRPESETYFLRKARPEDYNEPLPGMALGTLKRESVILLDQVPGYASAEVIGLANAVAADIESTFNLGLTNKQKEAREGVVLPYFDAQNPEGGDGGRILYDMGSEDDFDEEEDEI